MAPKRQLQELQQPAASKRVRLSDDQLSAMDKPDLVAKIHALEDELHEARMAVISMASVQQSGGMSAEEAKDKADKARKLMIKGIKSQMKWKPSCKNGGAKFSYAGSLPDTAVFNVLTGQAHDAKKAKIMCSFTPGEFVETVADGESIYASVRYDTLYLVSKSVNVRWKEKDGEFTVNGSYGLSGCL